MRPSQPLDRTISGPPNKLALLDTAVLGAASLALYLLLAQDAYWGRDVHGFLWGLERGELSNPKHHLYLPLVGLLWQVTAPLGMAAYSCMQLASVLGTVAGVVLCHRAALAWGTGRGDAALIAGFCAAVPGVLHFATVGEVHGVFYGFAGAAHWAGARLAARPGVDRGLVTGIATGIAAAVHATGHLLPIVFAAMLLARHRARPLIAPGIVLAITHAVTALSAQRLVGASGTSFSAQVGFLTQHLELISITTFGGLVWNEWLLALAPTSACAFIALFVPRLRRDAIALHLALVPYLALCQLVLFGTDERGAYTLPLALPAAWLTLRLLGPRNAILALVAGLAIATTEVVRRDEPFQNAAYGEGAVALAEQEAIYVFGCGRQQLDSLLEYRVPARSVHELGHVDPKTTPYPRLCAFFDAYVTEHRGQGRTLLMTPAALATLQGVQDDYFGRLGREHLVQRYTLEPVTSGAFEALRVEPK